jgi:hypothetical protein
MPVFHSPLRASGTRRVAASGAHRAPASSPRVRRPLRQWGRALTCSAVIAAATLTATGPIGSAQAATPTILLGADGDVAGMSRGTGQPMATHTYRLFSEAVPTGAASITVRDPNASWRQVAAAGPGSALYANIVRWAQTIKARGGRQMLSYHHEAEASGSNRYGTPAEFGAAFRHVVSIFRAQGATNVEWVWQPTAFAFRVKPSDRRYYMNWYPGDAYVDNVGFDGYNAGTCYGRNEWSSIASFTDPVLAFVRAHHKTASLQEFAAPQDPRRAAWLQDVHSYLARNKDVLTAAFYFQNGATGSRCSWKLTTSAEFKAYADTARDASSFRSS